MPDPDDTMTRERRVAEQADAIVADDVASTAATGRIKKRVTPRRLHPFLPPGSAGVGCLLVLLLLVGTGLTVALTAGPPAPPTQATPTPTAVVTPTPTPPLTATPTPTALGTPTPSPTSVPTLADLAHALTPPDQLKVIRDTGDQFSYAYVATSERSVTELDVYYRQKLAEQGYELGTMRAFDGSVVWAFGRPGQAIVGNVIIEQLADRTKVVQVVLVQPAPETAGAMVSKTDPSGDVVTDSGQAATDPEVDVTSFSIQKVGDRYRVTVRFGSGFTRKFSFAGLLIVGRQSPSGPIQPDTFFIWQTHGDPPEALIGQVDRQTGQVIGGPAEGVLIVFDEANGTMVFEFAAELLPVEADRLVIQAFHKPSEAIERDRDQTDVLEFGGIICGGTCRP